MTSDGSLDFCHFLARNDIQVFENRSVNFRFNTVDSLRFDLGKKFIILPNPIYGDWTKPLTGERKDWLNTKGKLRFK